MGCICSKAKKADTEHEVQTEDEALRTTRFNWLWNTRRAKTQVIVSKDEESMQRQRHGTVMHPKTGRVFTIDTESGPSEDYRTFSSFF